MSAWFGASRKPGGTVVCVVALIAVGLTPAAVRAQDPVEGEPALPPVRFEDASDLLDFCHGGTDLGFSRISCGAELGITSLGGVA